MAVGMNVYVFIFSAPMFAMYIRIIPLIGISKYLSENGEKSNTSVGRRNEDGQRFKH